MAKKSNPISVRAALLQTLTKGPRSSLEILEVVTDRTNGKITISEGSLYPNLWELERDGLVKTYQGEPLAKPSGPGRRGRPRKFYELTAEGMRCANEERASIGGLFGFDLQGAMG